MILQSLSNYYIRKLVEQDDEQSVPPYGMDYVDIKFIIEIDEDGNFRALSDIRKEDKSGQKKLVPRAVTRTSSGSWKRANLLWDNYEYVLGQSEVGKENANTEKQLGVFVDRIVNLPEDLKNEVDIAAVIKFYQKEGHKKVLEDPNWHECHKIAKCNMTFQLYKNSSVVTENPKLVAWVVNDSEEEGIAGRCLVTGEVGTIARTHAQVSVGNRQKVRLVSFKEDKGYDSYGKEQGYNAPVSEKAEFYYTTALNMLIKSTNNNVTFIDSKGQKRVTLLFWSEPSPPSEKVASDAELAVRALIYGKRERRCENADFGVRNAKNIFEAIFSGKVPTTTEDKFCILGIAPNQARLRVVFWKRGTIKEIATNVMQFFNDVELSSYKGDTVQPSVYAILRASEFQGKMDNVPSNMIPAMIQAIFNNAPLPSSVFGHIMERLRAERNPSEVRVAFLKAYLNRKYRNSKGDKITVSLNKESKDEAYRLGRLMAVLEEIQKKANPEINATIMDRFYSSMSSTPIAVLPALIRLKNHHMAKLSDERRKIYFERLICEIFNGIDIENMPKHMSLERQANFAVGYYHQREDLFRPKEDKNKNDGTSAAEEQNIEE